MKPLCVNIRMKAIEQYFYVVVSLYFDFLLLGIFWSILTFKSTLLGVKGLNKNKSCLELRTVQTLILSFDCRLSLTLINSSALTCQFCSLHSRRSPFLVLRISSLVRAFPAHTLHHIWTFMLKCLSMRVLALLTVTVEPVISRHPSMVPHLHVQ